uniref:Uncharacterized protein n=1 Tax=Anguilla anguilla TaxID=7936 RepID=A0A0E9X8S9_ANGAN
MAGYPEVSHLEISGKIPSILQKPQNESAIVLMLTA